MTIEKTTQEVKNAIKRKLLSQPGEKNSQVLNACVEAYTRTYLTGSQKLVNNLLAVTKDLEGGEYDSVYQIFKWLLDGGLDAELADKANSSNASE